LEIEGAELNLGDLCPLKSQLRPHVVWFGEAVPAMDPAFEICARADYFIVVGTSLNVYPAAGLIHQLKPGCKVFLVDPDPNIKVPDHVTYINEKASLGLTKLAQKLLLEE
jgi:NAD-dependent deacetylase